MTTHTTSSPARTDLAAQPVRRAGARPYLRHGLVLAAGATAWSAAMAVVGLDPSEGAESAAFAASSGLFQVGLLCLLRVLWRTRALGAGRLARVVLRVEAAAVVLALGSTTADGLGVSDMDQLAWSLLDAFWPLSMLGMFLIGIRIAVAGRWTGVRRFWPAVAESWAVVTIPALAVLGETGGLVVGCTHLLVGYAVLGLLVATRRE